jgi:hypothetical protein
VRERVARCALPTSLLHPPSWRGWLREASGESNLPCLTASSLSQRDHRSRPRQQAMGCALLAVLLRLHSPSLASPFITPRGPLIYTPSPLLLY